MTMPTHLMQRAHDEVMAEDGPALPDKPRRRTFTAEYKLAIVEAYDACAGDSDKGALLRREGLYSSQSGRFIAPSPTPLVAHLPRVPRQSPPHCEPQPDHRRRG